MDRKTQDLLYNIGKTILHETSEVSAKGLTMNPAVASGASGHFFDAPKSIDFNTDGIEVGDKNKGILQREADIARAEDSIGSVPANPKEFHNMLLKRQLDVIGAKDPEERTLDDFGSYTPQPTISATPGTSPVAPIGFFDRVSGMASDAKNSIGDFWDARSTPEKIGIGALAAGVPLALTGSYLAYKKMKENKKR